VTGRGRCGQVQARTGWGGLNDQHIAVGRQRQGQAVIGVAGERNRVIAVLAQRAILLRQLEQQLVGIVRWQFGQRQFCLCAEAPAENAFERIVRRQRGAVGKGRDRMQHNRQQRQPGGEAALGKGEAEWGRALKFHGRDFSIVQ